MKKQLILGGLLAATLAPFANFSAFAHEADCPVCAQPITQDTATQDNEVALKFGRKRIEYKCVFCAFSDAKTEYKGDLSILAPSEKKGQPVIIKRTGEKWTTLPAGAAFTMPARLKHKTCQESARAYSSLAAAQKAAKAGDWEVLTLAQLLERAK